MLSMVGARMADAMTAASTVAQVRAAGVGRDTALAVAPVTSGDSPGIALAWVGGQAWLAAGGGSPGELLGDLADLDPRWVWWSAREVVPVFLDAGLRPRACWDLGAVGRMLHGLRRDDPGAVWAAAHGLAEPARAPATPGLFDLDDPASAAEPVQADGALSREWAAGGWATEPERAVRWARTAVTLQRRQDAALRQLDDPRPMTPGQPLPLLTARSESAAAMLAVELGRDGLPIDRAGAAEMLTGLIGRRPVDAADEAKLRAERDRRVLDAFAGQPVDLRSPAQVRELLTRVGFDLPDTRSWRLEPHAATMAPVAELLAWRKAERLATTYGWGWLDRQVGSDGRLRGAWGAADAAAGRMTAGAGLHNLPAELRPVVRAEPGHVLVRADLGQIEPRVLAVVSRDAGLARATADDDMYAPVAAALGCDRPTAKVAVLAAMYGQTSGTAGAALRDMDRAYPEAMAYLRAAEHAGLVGTDLRTHGGRLLRMRAPADVGGEPTGEPVSRSGHGRYARNAVVQGAAAEFFKAWAVTVRTGLAGLGDAQIVLCLHDELLLQVRADVVPRARDLLERSLAATGTWWAAGSGVRFVAEITAGASWADTH